MKSKLQLLVLAVLALSLAPLLSHAQATSRVIPFNNVATTLPPCAAPPDPACPKPVNVTVQVWQDATSVAPADLIFSEAQPSASLDDAGSVSFVFGSQTAGGLNPAHFPSGSSRFLDVVDPATGASVLPARLPLNATPFALSPGPAGPQGPPGVVQTVTAGDPSVVTGGTPTNPTVAVARNGITNVNVADGALSPAKITGTAATLGSNTFNGAQTINAFLSTLVPTLRVIGSNTGNLALSVEAGAAAIAGNGTNVLIGNAGCGAPTAAIGIGTLRDCTNFALGANPLLNELVLNRPFGGQISFRESNNGRDQMRIAPGGNVGIGTNIPGARLDVTGNGADVLIGDPGCGPGSQTVAIGFLTNARLNCGDNFNFGASTLNKETVINRPTGGRISFREGNGPDQMTIASGGTTSVRVLQILGGADVSERFEVSARSTSTAETPQERIEPGMVVSIDPKHPGKLTVSRMAYDPRAAGVISGAGGVQPGMLMGQSGSVADGDQPVALAGRVYCWADASHGPIEPGDLLTTSETPGHAMKVTDHGRAQGAIIGKAMTGLKESKGLVLVLVTLQ